MIVFDENIHQQSLMSNVARWYRGQVVSIRELRRGTLIQDEAIPSLLQRFKEATFITTNISDFWRRIPAHRRYCVICFALPNEQTHEIPALIRRLFHSPEFRAKAARMGKVVRVGRRKIQYYEVGADLVETLEWLD
jgi:hypothetical protein